MKTFDSRFLGGAVLTGVGSVGVIAGALSLLPPTNNFLLSILLVAVCLPIAMFGYRFAKNVHPNPAKTSVETLRKAGLLNKNNK